MRNKKQDNKDSDLFVIACNCCSTDKPLSKSRKTSNLSFDRTGFRFDGNLCTCQQKEQVLQSSRPKNSVGPVSDRTVNHTYVAKTQITIQKTTSGNHSKHVARLIAYQIAYYESILNNFRKEQTRKYF